VTQIFGLYGWQFAVLLVLLAAIVTYFLLPEKEWPATGDGAGDEAGGDPMRRVK
jgi:hypothetical protein